VTTPNQPAPSKALDLIGTGAYVVGGGEDGTGYGQSVNESFVKGLFELPMATLDNMMEVFRMALRFLPLEALNFFEPLIPDWIDGGETVDSVVDKLIDALDPRQIPQTLAGFAAWLLTLLPFGAGGGGNPPAGGNPITSLTNWFLGLWGLLGNPDLGGGGGGPVDNNNYTLQDLLNLVGTNNTIPPHMLAQLSPSGGANRLPDTFSRQGAMDGQGDWVWEFPSRNVGAWGAGGCVRTRRPGLITIFYVPPTWEVIPGAITYLISMGGKYTYGHGNPKDFLKWTTSDWDAVGIPLGVEPKEGTNLLDWNHFEFIVVPYSGPMYPMGAGIAEGVANLTALIHACPGKFILMGHSQGAGVISEVLDSLRTGNLQDRYDDLLMGWAYGNIRREQGRGFPGPDGEQVVYCPDGWGISEPTLTDTPDHWWEWSVPAGTYPANGDLEGVTYPTSDSASCLGDDELAVELRKVFASTADVNTFSFFGFIGEALQLFLTKGGQALQATLKADSPHFLSAYEMQPFLEDGDTRTYWQYTFDYFNNRLADLVTPPAIGQEHELEGVPVPVQPFQEVTASVWTQWLNVYASGPAIMLAVNAYDADFNFIGQVNFEGTTIFDPDPESDWVQLEADFIMPEGAAWARHAFWCSAEAMTTGIVWAADPYLGVTNLIAGDLIQVATLEQLALAQMSGPQGIADLLTGLANVIDGLHSSNTQQVTTGNDLAQLFESQGQVALNASTAIDKVQEQQQVLGNVSTQPLSSGMQPSGEVTIPLSAFPVGAVMPSATVLDGTSILGFINIAQNAKKTYVKFLAEDSGETGIFVNIYEVEKLTGDMFLRWASADISASVPDGSWGWVKIEIDELMTVEASDLMAIEIVSEDSDLAIAAVEMPWPNDETEIPQNLGAVRTTSGISSPATLDEDDLTFSGTIPFIAFGGETLDGLQPPDETQFTIPGTHPYAIPAWMVEGDFIDAVILPGAGGGGTLPDGTPGTAQGGLPGEWLETTLEYGVDIPAGTEELTVVVGDGGAAGAPGAHGIDGEASSVYGVGVTALNAPGGLGGGLEVYKFFDALGLGGENYTNGGTAVRVSYPHTPVAEPEAVLVFVAATRADPATGDGGATATVTATYGGVEMEELIGPPGIPQGTLTFSGLRVFGLIDPPAGVQTVEVVTTLSASKDFRVRANSVSYVGVSGFGTPVGAFGTTQALSMTVPCEPGQFVAQAFISATIKGFFSASLGAAYKQTKRLDQAGKNPGYFDWVIGDAPGGFETLFTANSPLPGAAWQGVGVPLIPSGTGNTNPSSKGLGPENNNFNGKSYFGGHDVAAGKIGSGPGGAGGSGAPGRSGGVWLTGRQQS
jgi:hypothetical protein